MEAALGEGAAESVKKLTKTLAGSAGELAEMDANVRSLTQEQLENGAALDIMAAKFAGFAKSEAKTFSGSIEQSANAFGGLQEEIGFAITDNQLFVDVADEVTDALVDVSAIVKENRGAFAEFARDGLQVAFRAFDQFLEAVADSKLAFAFAKQALLEYANTALDKLSPLLKAVFDEEDVQGWVDGLDAAIAKTNEEVEAATEWRNTVNEVREEFEGVGKALEESVNKPMQDAVDKAKELQATVEDTKPPQIAGTPIPAGGVPEGGQDSDPLTVKIEEDGVERAADTIGTAVSAAGASAGGAINAAMQVATQIAASLFEGVGQEVIKAVSSIGPVVAAIIDALASFSAEDFQGLIDGLIQGFVTAMSNIGPFIALLANNLDEILQGLLVGLVSGVASLIANLPNILLGLFSAVFEGITQFGPRFRKAFDGIGKGVSQTFKMIVADFKEAFANIVASAFEPVAEAFGKVLDFFGGFGDKVAEGTETAFASVGDAIVSFFDSFLDLEELKAFYRGTVLGAVRGVRDFFVEVGNVVGGFMREYIAEPLKNMVAAIGSAVQNVGRFIRDEVAGAIRDAGRAFGAFVSDSILDPIADVLKAMANAIIGAINFVIGGLNQLPFVDIPTIPKFHDGGVFDAGAGRSEGLAMLKNDEVVVNQQGQANILDAIAQGGAPQGGASGAPIQVTIQERRESSGEFRQLVLDSLDDLIRGREIQDIRMGATA